jgi:hypothetical protein
VHPCGWVQDSRLGKDALEVQHAISVQAMKIFILLMKPPSWIFDEPVKEIGSDTEYADGGRLSRWILLWGWVEPKF